MYLLGYLPQTGRQPRASPTIQTSNHPTPIDASDTATLACFPPFCALPGRVYLGDRDLNVVSYDLPLAVLEYQTAVMRDDLETADEVMPRIPAKQRTRVAHFLEKRGTCARLQTGQAEFEAARGGLETDVRHGLILGCGFDRLQGPSLGGVNRPRAPL